MSKIGSVVKVCKNSGGVARVGGGGGGVLLALAEFHWCQRSQQGLAEWDKPLWSMCIHMDEFYFHPFKPSLCTFLVFRE